MPKPSRTGFRCLSYFYAETTGAKVCEEGREVIAARTKMFLSSHIGPGNLRQSGQDVVERGYKEGDLSVSGSCGMPGTCSLIEMTFSTSGVTPGSTFAVRETVKLRDLAGVNRSKARR
ncbi:MAG: hypothetical protein DME38_00120 [Verrucomicrobia bacterium]|nr:MAG: hypothetical protein DME38_00120 [Verrucomicrobiota bacterium]